MRALELDARRALASSLAIVFATHLALSQCASASARDAGTFQNGVAVVTLCALLVGRLATILSRAVPPTPSLATQIVCGVFLRNVPGIRTAIGVAGRDAAALARAAALGLILTRAGLALDAGRARRRARDVALVALGPSTMEMLVDAGLGVGMFGLPVSTAFALGFLMCGISLAVVVPPAVDLQRRGYASGVCDLILGASAFDGIYCVVGFGICAGVAGSGGGADAAWRAPAQLFGGAALGLIATKSAFALGLVTTKEKESTANADGTMILSIVMLMLFASKELNMNGGGALACVVFCVSLATEWRTQGLGRALREVSVFMNVLWNEFTAPLLFVIIGMALDLSALDGDTAGKAIAIVVIGGIARAIGVFLTTATIDSMNWSERAFLAMAWTPKATIQAALAGVVYDQATLAHGVDSPQARDGEKLLQSALLCILMTAPLGAWCIEYFSTKLLRLDDETTDVVVEVTTSNSGDKPSAEEHL